MPHIRAPRSHGIARSTVVAALVLVGAGCSEHADGGPQVPDPNGPQSLSLYLSGAAAEQLQPDGSLRISNVQTAGRRPQIDETRARDIATAFIATHLAGLLAALERDRGASINAENVAVCPRVFYAESAFEELPEEVPGVYHRMYGPWWLTSLCTPAGEPVVALGISAYATELGISGGKLMYPENSGGEFRWVGIRPGDDNLLPVSPENAVRLAAGMANRRISAITRLVARRPGSGYPQLSQWQLTLDREADVRIPETATVARTRELFVSAEAGSKAKIRVASPQQPDAVDVEWRPRSDIEQNPVPPARTTRLARRAGIPVMFQEVVRGGGQ